MPPKAGKQRKKQNTVGTRLATNGSNIEVFTCVSSQIYFWAMPLKTYSPKPD